MTLFDRVINVTLYCDKHVDDPTQLKGIESVYQSIADKVGSKTLAAKMPYLVAAQQPIKAEDVRYVIRTDKCTVKPNIHVTMRMLPGQHVYNCKVELSNFVLQKGIDIRTINTIDLEIGYRQGGVQGFSCPVFSSYQTSPNPNGVTVFNCLTVGRFGRDTLFTESDFTFKFKCKEMKLKDVFENICKDMGFTKYETFGLPASFWDDADPVDVLDWELKSTTCYGILNQFMDKAKAVADAYNDKNFGATPHARLYLLLDLSGDSVRLIGNWVPQEASVQETVVHINSVKGTPTFAGPVITFSSLYIPSLVPGSLFDMPTYYYNGDKLPNVLQTKTMQQKKGLFRAVTVDIDFSTTGNNLMTVMGVPARNEEVSKDDSDDVQDVHSRFEKYMKEATRVNVVYGEETPSETDMEGSFWNTSGLPSLNISQYTVQKGDTLAGIAKQFWGTNKLFIVGSEIDLTKAPADKKSSFKRDIAAAYFHVLIMLYTYKASADTSVDWTFTKAKVHNMKDPNNIDEGTVLAIPALTKETVYDQMLGKEAVAKHFDDYVDFLTKNGDKWSELNVFQSIAFYLRYGAKK